MPPNYYYPYSPTPYYPYPGADLRNMHYPIGNHHLNPKIPYTPQNFYPPQSQWAQSQQISPQKIHPQHQSIKYMHSPPNYPAVHTSQPYAHQPVQYTHSL